MNNELIVSFLFIFKSVTLNNSLWQAAPFQWASKLRLNNKNGYADQQSLFIYIFPVLNFYHDNHYFIFNNLIQHSIITHS